MGRKSKAVASGKENGDGAPSNKKMKVSDEVEESVMKEEDEGPWEGIRTIPDSEQDAICRAEDCQNQATATWTSMKTGDEWNMCDACQLRDFGECCQGKTSAPKNAPATQGNNEKADQDLKCPTVDPFNENDNASDPIPKSIDTTAPASREDPKSSCEEAPSPASQALVVDDANVSGKSSSYDAKQALEAPSVSSSDDRTTDPVTSDTTIHDASLAPVITQTQGSSGEDDEGMIEDGDDEEDEGQYDLKKILSFQDLSKSDTICCSMDACGGLPAFGLYVNSKDAKDRWFYCLDCQEDDFEGWPPLADLPTKHLDPEHLRLMASKCSRRNDVAMPIFLDSAASSRSPIPSGKSNSTSAYTDTSTPAAAANFVTPPPNSRADIKDSKSKGKSGSKDQPIRNARALEAHKKWLDAAQAVGGKEARIVVSKPAAKKLIFDFLYDAFQPMNITQIYKGLKAIVPQPVLNACLQEMVPDKFGGKNPFEDDDSEDDEGEGSEISKAKPAASTELYSESLIFKSGKNMSTNLYFVDYNKIKGMDRDEREALNRESTASKAEEEALKATSKSTKELTIKLLSEPSNEELAIKLEAEEKVIHDLEEQLHKALKLKINENHKQKTKKRIQISSAHWRQRKRLCENFLTALEENTDGSITRTKCLKGDGPIALDSDEAVAKAAVQYAKDKKSRGNARGGGLQSRKTKKMISAPGKFGGGGGKSANLALGSDLVAVVLNKQLLIERIYAIDE